VSGGIIMTIKEKHSLLILLIIVLMVSLLTFNKLMGQNQKQTYYQNYSNQEKTYYKNYLNSKEAYYQNYPNQIDIEKIKIDYIANQIIECESNNKMVWGDNHLPVKAYGVAQFQLETFNWLKKLANRPELNYYSEEDQVWLLKWAIKNKKGYLWTCYNKLNLTRFE